MHLMKTAKTISMSDIRSTSAQEILSRCIPVDGCFVWPGATTKKNSGYGRVTILGTVYCCHRVIWTCAKGEIPDSKIICHTCDNPLCCNVEHMFIGTQKANMEDMNKKGGAVKNPAKGVKSINASLTQTQVDYIRANVIKGDMHYGYTQIANKFGVSINTISRVANMERYK